MGGSPFDWWTDSSLPSTTPRLPGRGRQGDDRWPVLPLRQAAHCTLHGLPMPRFSWVVCGAMSANRKHRRSLSGDGGRSRCGGPRPAPGRTAAHGPRHGSRRPAGHAVPPPATPRLHARRPDRVVGDPRTQGPHGRRRTAAPSAGRASGPSVVRLSSSRQGTRSFRTNGLELRPVQAKRLQDRRRDLRRLDRVLVDRGVDGGR